MKKKAALTTAMVALPFTLAPTLRAQISPADQMMPIDQTVRAGRSVPRLELCCLKFAERYTKQRSTYTIVGTDNEHTIYQNARNEYFYLDPATGDMTFLAPDAFVKWRPAGPESRSAVPLKVTKQSVVKVGEQVTILGFDQAGHVVQQNAQGEAFYLDPSTGDMVVVK